ncbi:cysteine desulfurase NifS [Methanoplanus sp. FWC-SCC4]|uniref:Cysteine desulfurase IscS n=1 Tax=Methanochimaera problematica TaxID=2609417 RepID=A0AA97FD16_9EURY|nr:cysteine desulfurase NifS [Methanoplanus sp. FWC-SCC4]WOF17260.1 cysteine desulfurase NifS [Methanoplanus sp. FWC-SCC4]
MDENKRIVYMDYAATTPTRPEVAAVMTEFMTEHFGNPSSLYDIAKTSKEAVTKAREQVASAINAKPKEIYFTSGGTESDNWAIKGTAFANQEKGKHIITSSIEHHAVSRACEWLEKQGFEITYLPVDRYGVVNPKDVEAAIRDDTILITIMFANNEIGTIEPIAEIGKIAREKGVLFHTDAVQAVGHVPIDVEAMNIDMLSMSGHKFYGPKGTGALYIGRKVKIDPLMHGGDQERRRRAGTENVPGIVGLGLAIELAVAEMNESSSRISAMRDRLIENLLKVPASHLNGHPEDRLPNNVNIVFEYIEGESILLMLNRKGIAASTGSACNSASLEPSHVLTACGIPAEIVHGSLRLTLGDQNTEDDVDYVLGIIPEIVQRLRNMSPLTPAELRG